MNHIIIRQKVLNMFFLHSKSEKDEQKKADYVRLFKLAGVCAVLIGAMRLGSRYLSKE
jgi:hypothetical protein